MGFFSNLGKGLLGGVGGFLAGGPLGAAAGFAGGLLSSDPSSRMTNMSANQTSTTQTQLRGLDPTEQGLHDASSAGAMASMQQMTPEAQAQMLQQNREALLSGSNLAINTSYDDAAARQYANEASRGAAGGSTGNARADRQQALRGRELGLASDRATIESQNMMLQQRADRRANAAQYMNNLRDVWNRQLQGSAITTTGSSTSTTLAPDTTIPDAMGLIGHGLTSPDSYYNNDLLGGI